jgi:hypothetical protein
MVLLPIQHQPTVELIYKLYRDKASDFRRMHLGASQINKPECALFYSFRWCSDPAFESRILRLFESGFLEEDRIIKNLRAVGITVYSRDPDSGEQLHFKEEDLGGHFSGSVDGIGVNFPEAPKTYHVVELKTSSKKIYDKLVKEGIEKAKPDHLMQIQCYLRWSGLDRAMYIVCCKDDDRLYSERIYYNKDLAEQLVAKARRIIFSDVPLERISDNPDSMFCKWCEHSPICHGGRLPLVSCRTCAFVTPLQDGTWQCGRDNSILGEAKQKAGCDGHIFIPNLVNLEATDSDPEVGTITYGSIVNGPGGTLSKDLQKVIDGSK